MSHVVVKWWSNSTIPAMSPLASCKSCFKSASIVFFSMTSWPENKSHNINSIRKSEASSFIHTHVFHIHIPTLGCSKRWRSFLLLFCSQWPPFRSTHMVERLKTTWPCERIAQEILTCSTMCVERKGSHLEQKTNARPTSGTIQFGNVHVKYMCRTWA